jgi:hypothetical protein
MAGSKDSETKLIWLRFRHFENQIGTVTKIFRNNIIKPIYTVNTTTRKKLKDDTYKQNGVHKL